MKKFTAVCVILCFITVLAAPAVAAPPRGPHHGPGPWGPPPRPHHRGHDSTGIVVAGVLGLLVGAAIAEGSKNDSGRSAKESTAEEYRAQAKELARTESRYLLDTIDRLGADKALEYIDDQWHGKSMATLYRMGSPVSSLKVADVDRKFAVTYYIDSSKNYAYVKVEQPTNDILVTEGGEYLPFQAPVDLASIVGFTLSDGSRTPDRYMKLTSVVPATAADYAGMKLGTVLYRVDATDTSQVSCDQLAQYISERAGMHATLLLVAEINGVRKTVRVKL